VGDKTKVQWADATWNPVTGCTPVSVGCENCYAKRTARRLRGKFGYPTVDPFAVTWHPDRFEIPLRWKRPRRIFLCSMGDLFHSLVPEDIQVRLHEIMCKAEQHTFMILTKRPENMRRFYEFNRTLASIIYQPFRERKCPTRFPSSSTSTEQNGLICSTGSSPAASPAPAHGWLIRVGFGRCGISAGWPAFHFFSNSGGIAAWPRNYRPTSISASMPHTTLETSPTLFGRSARKPPVACWTVLSTTNFRWYNAAPSSHGRAGRPGTQAPPVGRR